jgi:hypothetical protein
VRQANVVDLFYIFDKTLYLYLITKVIYIVSPMSYSSSSRSRTNNGIIIREDF